MNGFLFLVWELGTGGGGVSIDSIHLHIFSSSSVANENNHHGSPLFSSSLLLHVCFMQHIHLAPLLLSSNGS